MENENIDSSLAIARSSVKTYAERRVKLNDTYIKKLRARNKIYSVGDSEMVGLRMYVRTSGSKIYYYCYKPLNEKNWVRYKIGNFNVLNVIQARDKAKKYAALIVEGVDPVLVKREMKTELSLEELKKIEPKLNSDVLKVFDLKNSVNSKKSYGGTAFDNIKKMIMKYKKQK